MYTWDLFSLVDKHADLFILTNPKATVEEVTVNHLDVLFKLLSKVQVIDTLMYVS